MKVEGDHNHPPSEHPSGHAVARRFSDEEKGRIRELAGNGIPVAQILNTLKSEFNNHRSVAQDVHNELQAYKRIKFCKKK